MALATHTEDQHGNVVAEEGVTRCVCGCKYWENDKCVDCGMTPERLWIIQSGERYRAMQRISLNIKWATMLHYDLPYIKDVHLSDHLDPLSVQQDIAALPKYNLRWNNGEVI